ncbi:MAG TPA: adenosylcobinamide-GDP ribazoletransferase [Burkholderiaceae bacterium]|nr:adenosylcobinamide-GDP ribazoletransferase [Burkholderiaceae bacterium]
MRAWRALGHEVRLALIALQFLTRVPIPSWIGFESQWLHASARHFPLVGMLVGTCAAAVLWASAWWWPMPIAVVLSIVATVWLTGGFHEDGLADTCDGLGGAVSRERALEIMKDSRLGSYGALGLVLMLALKALALVSLANVDLVQACGAIVFAHTVSRAATVVLLRVLPYAGDPAHAKAKPMAQRVSHMGVFIALAWGVFIAVPLCAIAVRPVTTATIATIACACVCGRWFKKRLGGYTGDTLGATQQLTEVACYLAWLASALRG